MTKGEKGLAAEVAVGAPFHTVLLEGRQVVYRTVKRDRQPPAGVIVAEQNVGDGCSPLFAGIPRLQDGGHVDFRPVDGQSAAAREHQDDRLAQRAELLEQRLLGARQGDVGAITPPRTLPRVRASPRLPARATIPSPSPRPRLAGLLAGPRRRSPGPERPTAVVLADRAHC